MNILIMIRGTAFTGEVSLPRNFVNELDILSIPQLRIPWDLDKSCLRFLYLFSRSKHLVVTTHGKFTLFDCSYTHKFIDI